MKSPDDRRYARRVVALIVIFFGVIFTVNGTMIYLAFASRDGLVEHDYYLKGLRYNEVILAEKRFQQLAWKTRLTLTTDRVTWSVTDPKGHMVPVSSARIRIMHPTRPGHDQEITATGTGSLTAPVQLIPSIWNVEIRLQWQGQELLHRERAEVKG